MPRRKKNAKRRRYQPLKFSELARGLGLTPRQKIIMLRTIRKHRVMKGGDGQNE